jgi:hypothetical protein
MLFMLVVVDSDNAIVDGEVASSKRTSPQMRRYSRVVSCRCGEGGWRGFEGDGVCSGWF